MNKTMWNRVFSKPILIFSILLSLLLWIGESYFHYWVFDPGHPFEFIPSDQNELWMRLLICGIVIVFGAYGQRQANKKRILQEEKLRTLKATMHTVEDRVGNSLLSIKYLLNNAESERNIDRQTSKDIMHLIDDTMVQLREIHALDEVKEKRFSGDTYCLDTRKRSGMHQS